uniref:MFS transporter n=1 Tax=Rhodococcus qingshengii TaxID=334542 RepID=UPI001C4DE7F7|nr:MFS transporter [Rhodococcus qingshengii]
MAETAETTRGAEVTDIRYARRVVLVMSLAAIMAGLNMSTLHTALPAIVRYFDASPSQANLVVLSYMLVSTVLILICGRVSDLFGRKNIFLSAMILYSLTCFLQGFAGSVEILICLRLLQAAAAAMLLANSAALISSAMPAGRLGWGMGLYLAAWSASEMIGPVVGGLIVTAAGWQWVFWFNVPVGIVCVILGALILRADDVREVRRSLDLRGNALFILALGGLITALSQGNDKGWTDPLVVGGAILCAVCSPIFIWYERRIDDPVMNMAIVKAKSFALANISGFMNIFASAAMVVVLALYFQVLWGMSAFDAGLALLPLSGATVLGSVIAGWLTPRWATPNIAVHAAAATTLGLVLVLVSAASQQSPPVMMAASAIVGLGCGIFLPANITTILAGIESNRLGIVNAIRMTLQNTAYVTGTAVGLVVLTAPLAADVRLSLFSGDPNIGADSTSQLINAYVITFGMMVVASCIGWTLAIITRNSKERGVVKTPS